MYDALGGAVDADASSVNSKGGIYEVPADMIKGNNSTERNLCGLTSPDHSGRNNPSNSFFKKLFNAKKFGNRLSQISILPLSFSIDPFRELDALHRHAADYCFIPSIHYLVLLFFLFVKRSRSFLVSAASFNNIGLSILPFTLALCYIQFV